MDEKKLVEQTHIFKQGLEKLVIDCLRENNVEMAYPILVGSLALEIFKINMLYQESLENLMHRITQAGELFYETFTEDKGNG